MWRWVRDHWGVIKISRGRYLVQSLQGHRINLTDVVGFRGGIKVISVFNKIASAIVSEVRHCVVEKGNCPEDRRHLEKLYILERGGVLQHKRLIIRKPEIF